MGLNNIDDELLVLTRRMNDLTSTSNKKYTFSSWIPRLLQMSMIYYLNKYMKVFLAVLFFL